jgi:hypothetical protein
MIMDINIEEEEKSCQLKALRFLIGRNVLIDYYIYRECIELPSFSGRST